MKKIEILILLIVGLVPLLWYKPGYIGFGHDMGFPLAPIDHFVDRFYSWTERLGPFGSNSVQAFPGMFVHGLEALLSIVGFSLLNVQKLTFIFWFVLPGFSMYALLHYLHPDKEDYLTRISGSLFYMMNHFLLQGWVIAERTKFSVVAALPIVIILVIKVLHKNEKVLKNSILVALTLFVLNGGEGIPLIATLFWAILIISLVLFTNTRKLISFLSLSIIFWLLLSSYWLYPYLKSYTQILNQRIEDAWGISGVISWSQGISANASWINLFKLRGIPDWYANPDHPYANTFFANPLLIILSLIFPAFAMVGLMNLNKIRIAFWTLLLVAIPLAAGSHSPLGILYDYLLINIPGFVMFRSGFFKFGMMIWFAYSYLIAVAINDVVEWGKTKFARPVVTVLFVAFLFIYNYPFFMGNFFSYARDKSTMVKVPDYIFQAKKELDSNKFSTRTLFLPNTDLRTGYIEYEWGYFGVEDILHFTGRKASIINGILARPNETHLLTAALSEHIKLGTSNLVQRTGVERAIIQNDFVSPDYEGNPLSGLVELFKKSPDFAYDKSIGRWDFYNYNKQVLPQIQSPARIALISSSKENLSWAGNLLGELSVDAFVWSAQPKGGIKSNIFNKFLIEAECADCPIPKNYQIYLSPSKFLVPGTPFYYVGKLLTEFKKYLTHDPKSKLEINLSTLATLNSDLGVLQARDKEKGIQIIVDDYIKNLSEIRENISLVSDQTIKLEMLNKVHFYLSLFLSYESQWANAARPGLTKLVLTNLEHELKIALAETEKGFDRVKVETDNKSYKYILNLSIEGAYNLYLNRKTTLKVNDRLYTTQRLDSRWYTTGQMLLKGSPIIEIPISESPEGRPVLFAVLEKNVTLGSPDTEFVALNQTKYLVKVEGSSPSILNFNSRFDNNWDLREVDPKIASKYFVGGKKSFLDGKVIEYERGDKHLITDLVFPHTNQSYKPLLELNGFSNGWFLNSPGTYLLEYNLQNEFYKAAGISLVSLAIILGLYFFKNND